MENDFPGLWLRWLKNQCVAVGWPPASGYHLRGDTKQGSGWQSCRKLLTKINIGDLIVASMAGSRVGRLGEVTGLAVEDSEWKRLIPISDKHPSGEMGRRVLVRWYLDVGPMDFDLVVKLPEASRFKGRNLRATLAKVTSPSVETIINCMNDPTNWVGLSSRFASEAALSDYIATYPHRLEDGLAPHPDYKRREISLPDKTRLDVLLIDKRDTPVIVECKQHSPSIEDIQQLERYMAEVGRIIKRQPRGILVHGGTRKLSQDVSRYLKNRKVETVSYALDIDFRNSE